MNRPVLLAVCLATVLFGTAPARAQSAAAEALFDKGRELMTAGNYEAACQSFQESDRLDPAVGTRFNLADCEEKRGRLATAWELFRAVERDLREDDERLPVARDRSRALEQRVPRLKVTLRTGAPADSRVRCDGVTLGPASLGLALPMDPGRRECVVQAAGHPDRKYEVELKPGATTALEVQPGSRAPTPEARPAPPAKPRPMPAPAETSGGASVFGIVALSVGVVGLGAGTVTGLMTLHQKQIADDHCSDALRRCDRAGKDANDSGRRLGVISTTSFAVGVLGVGLGTAFILSSGKSEKPQTALVAGLGPAGAELGLIRRF